jgi:hypothetical protein
MGASQGRDRAAALAKFDASAALREAREVSDPRYRAQALAYVARFAPESEIEPIAEEAFDACRRCPDPYQQAASAAWPLCALVERGAVGRAREALAVVLAEPQRIEPASSRSEALFLLFQACFALGAQSREALARRLVAAHREARHWRSRRNLIDALVMLDGSARGLAAELAASAGDESVRKKVEESQRANVRRRPRAFFS